MKNGTAISGKESTPLMTFWAMIWESKIPRYAISATPQTISANAIGMPIAMAASNEDMKTATVMRFSLSMRHRLFGLADRDQIRIAKFSCEQQIELADQDDA
jgi:hypothetical protein